MLTKMLKNTFFEIHGFDAVIVERLYKITATYGEQSIKFDCQCDFG